nr:hypothetical protein [Tanacetum cinerariifolium]
KLIHNSILNEPYVRKMIPELGDVNRDITIEADDQAIQTILLGLPKDIYAAVDSCETAQEIWLRVQQMMKGSDIGIQEKKAKLFNEWERWLEVMVEISLGTGQNENQIRCYNCRRKEEVGIQLQAEEYDLMAAAADLDEIEEVNANCILMANLQQASTSGTQTDSAPVYDTDRSAKEQYLSKKINALYLSSGTQIMTLNEQISELNKQLSKEKSTVSFLLEEKKRLKSDFKTYEDNLLDKQILLEKRIKELNNIVLKTGQSIQTIYMLSPKPNSFYHTEQKMALGYQNPFYLNSAQKKQQSLYDGKVLLEKHDPPVVHDSEETLQLAQESRDKMKQMNKEIKPANYIKINHLLRVFVPQKALSHEELYFLNNSKTANVLKSFLIPNEDFSDDTTPSVARKFLNE